MDGYELAKKMRAISRLSNMRLLALTGYGRARITIARARPDSTITSSSRWI
jgi:hypothetical protein